MKRLLFVGGILLVAVYFIYINYRSQPVKLMDVADVIGVIDETSLSHMFLVSYPEEEVYDTRDKEEIQKELEVFLNMEVRKVKKVKETEKYHKLTFDNDEGYQMQLILYENGTGSISSNYLGVIGSTASLEIVDETFKEHIQPLLLKDN